jgi:hypothetical protein
MAYEDPVAFASGKHCLASGSSPKMTFGDALKIRLQTKAPADSSAGALFDLACAYFAQQCA